MPEEKLRSPWINDFMKGRLKILKNAFIFTDLHEMMKIHSTQLLGFPTDKMKAFNQLIDESYSTTNELLSLYLNVLNGKFIQFILLVQSARKYSI